MPMEMFASVDGLYLARAPLVVWIVADGEVVAALALTATETEKVVNEAAETEVETETAIESSMPA